MTLALGIGISSGKFLAVDIFSPSREMERIEYKIKSVLAIGNSIDYNE